VPQLGHVIVASITDITVTRIEPTDAGAVNVRDDAAQAPLRSPASTQRDTEMQR
jgi:hypothetical protein